MRLGAFELGAPLGEGGMGIVWHGRHINAGLDVAVKVLLPEVMGNPEYLAAFEQEVRSVASLDHPNIVTILDYGVVPQEVGAKSPDLPGGSPYLVMEYARGGEVSDYFTKLKWPDMRELLLVVLDALAHAHARDVIHRDLKPENILVGCGPNWDVKLTDFGLAHAADRFDDSGNVEAAWGTPQYMAPEQLRGFWREYGPWTDLYGLGCMAYELICAKWPFDGKTAWEIGQSHLKDPIPRLEPRFEVPEGTEDWIRKLLAKRRSQRFNHAADAAYALAQLPALDDAHRFGVLFEAPTSVKENAPRPVDTGTPDTSTQIMPELQSVVAKPGAATQMTAPPQLGPSGKQRLERPSSMMMPLRAEVPPLPATWRRRDEGTLSNELMGISLGLFGLRTTPLVDRDQERDGIWRLLHEVRDQGSSMQLLVEGSAGTGKSELVRWVCRRAREVGGARVLTAYHSPVLGPADGLVPMMERFLKCARLKPQKLEDYLGKVLIAEGLAGDFDLRALLSIFERGEADKGESGRGQHLGRQERYAIVYRYLSLLARRRPVIVWLDDVQWGLDALGFSEYVERRQSHDPAPILVIMTARTEALELRPTEKRAVDNLLKTPRIQRCVLPPLQAEDTDRLVRQLLRLNEKLANHILKRSEGVPLFAVQLVEDWVARGKLVMGEHGFTLKEGANIEIPDDLHQLWDSRIQGFLETKAPDTLHYIELAAALGQEVDKVEWKTVQEVAGLPPVTGLVERMIQENLAREMEEGWQFSHGMMQESLERGAREENRWAKWNGFCARALDTLYDGDELGIAERLAWHWIEAGESQRALAPLSQAVDQCIERSDYAHAVDLIEWRQELVDESSRWAIQNVIDRARVAGRRGVYKACTRLAENASELAEAAGHQDLLARARTWAGTGHRALGDLERAEELLTAAGDYFAQKSDPRWMAQCVLELGRVDEQRGDFEMARRHFEHGQTIFAGLDDDFGQAQCFNAVGDVTRQSGDFESAHRASMAALTIYKRLGNITGIADCLNDLAEWSRMQGDLEEAQSFAEEAVRLYHAVGSGDEYFVRLNLAMIMVEKEAYGDAGELFDILVDIFSQTGQTALLAQAWAGLLAANAGRSVWTGWSDYIEEIREISASTGVRAPMATTALMVAARLADEAQKVEEAQMARELAREQTRGIRQTLKLDEEELES